MEGNWQLIEVQDDGCLIYRGLYHSPNILTRYIHSTPGMAVTLIVYYRVFVQLLLV